MTTKPATQDMAPGSGRSVSLAIFAGQPAAFISFDTLMPNPDMDGRAVRGYLHPPSPNKTLQCRWSRQKMSLHEPPAKAFASQ